MRALIAEDVDACRLLLPEDRLAALITLLFDVAKVEAVVSLDVVAAMEDQRRAEAEVRE